MNKLKLAVMAGGVALLIPGFIFADQCDDTIAALQVNACSQQSSPQAASSCALNEANTVFQCLYTAGAPSANNNFGAAPPSNPPTPGQNPANPTVGSANPNNGANAANANNTNTSQNSNSNSNTNNNTKKSGWFF